jgi:hypothetical protein
MGLRLNRVAPAQGWQWIRQAFALWWRRPIAFAALFTFFFLSVMLLMVLVPVLGGPLGMALLPMLSLGFMVASRSTLAGGPAHALQLADGLRHPDRARRRAQWLLCGGYAIASMTVIALADWVDGGLFEKLQRLISQTGADGKPSPQLEAVLADPRLVQGMLVRVVLAGLLSVPFWHAPALVHWGGQGFVQAMFTSTLALWRNRAAFTVYLLGWVGLMTAVALLVMVVGMLTGARQALGLLTMPIGLVFSTVFYVSLWFSFTDTFGEPEPPLNPSKP